MSRSYQNVRKSHLLTIKFKISYRIPWEFQVWGHVRGRVNDPGVWRSKNHLPLGLLTHLFTLLWDAPADILLKFLHHLSQRLIEEFQEPVLELDHLIICEQLFLRVIRRFRLRVLFRIYFVLFECLVLLLSLQMCQLIFNLRDLLLDITFQSLLLQQFNPFFILSINYIVLIY
jgi:hypothetical protein